MRRNRKQSTELICRIDMTAFLSIQLVLLFTFIAQVSNHPDLPRNGTDLPKVTHAVAMQGANREDALVLAVQRDGRVWLGYDSVSADELPARIREAVSHGAEHKVYIRADARAKYGAVAQVLDRVRSSGVENIAFLVDERSSPPTAR